MHTAVWTPLSESFLSLRCASSFCSVKVFSLRDRHNHHIRFVCDCNTSEIQISGKKQGIPFNQIPDCRSHLLLRLDGGSEESIETQTKPSAAAQGLAETTQTRVSSHRTPNPRQTSLSHPIRSDPIQSNQFLSLSLLQSLYFLLISQEFMGNGASLLGFFFRLFHLFFLSMAVVA